MEIKKLEDLFYTENTHLKEVLDKNSAGKWDGEKTRGYGIVICEFNGLRFGIPLRSRIKHKSCFKTDADKGLDFSKAVLLAKDEYISSAPFVIPNDEHTKIIDAAFHIKKKFSKYVEVYINGVKKNDKNILNDYRFTTLQNYHEELGVICDVE